MYIYMYTYTVLYTNRKYDALCAHYAQITKKR